MKYEDLLARTKATLDECGNFEGRDLLEEFYKRGMMFEPSPVATVSFGELLKTQYDLQERMGWPTGNGIPGFKENMLAAHGEISEAVNEIPWKNWKPVGYKEVDRDALATELTDILQFVANAALCMDLTACELSGSLRRKWMENDRRIRDREVVNKEEQSDD